MSTDKADNSVSGLESQTTSESSGSDPKFSKGKAELPTNNSNGRRKTVLLGVVASVFALGLASAVFLAFKLSGSRNSNGRSSEVTNVGNFTGLGSVISFFDHYSSTKAFVGDPSAGCVTVFARTSGPDLYYYSETPYSETPVWEMVGEPICVGGTQFGAQIAPASFNLQGDDVEPHYEDYSVYDEGVWAEWDDNKSNRFIASNPTDNTLSLYMYSTKRNVWELKQTIEAPEGYELETFVAEDDTIAISYVTPNTTEALIHVYQVYYEYKPGFVAHDMRTANTSYKRVGLNQTFVGVDVDTDSEGHVVTLAEDRNVRAYYRSIHIGDGSSYSQHGAAFQPDKIIDDELVLEEDLTIVKCDYVDVILAAAVADTGADGKKTLGIESYDYDEAGSWVPSYRGTTEFEPNPTEETPTIHFDKKGTMATIATKNGFMVVSSFMVEVPTEFDLQFDLNTYASHKILGLSGYGVVSVLVKSTDGTEEIQNWAAPGW